MKRKCLSVFMLSLSAMLFLACTNLLDADKKSSNSAGISLTLPYAKSHKAGVFRAGDATNNRSLTFKVIFKHETGTETPFSGKSGDSIIFEKAPVGLYKISVQGYDDEGNKYEGYADAEVKDGETTTVKIILKREKKDDPIEINLLCHTDEQIKMIEKYIKSHTDCNIHLNYEIVETTNGQYTSFLDDALSGKSDKFIPDIYTAEAGFALRYTQGQMSQYALPYKDFISNLESKIQSAEIAQYTVDIGTRNGALVGLAYQTTGGAFIYRRSVAENVWGSQASDISFVENKIGAGSGNWNEFWNAAADCKEKGVAIVPGDGDLWHPVEASAEKGWVVNGKLHIDSNRQAFLDYSKKLWQNEYSNKSVDWSEDWYNDARGAGLKPVLGFFGPAWLLNFVLVEECKKDADTSNDTDWAICQSPVGFSWGGTWVLANKKLTEDTSDEGKKKLEAVSKIIEWMTLDSSEDGLQYQWANGLLENTKDTVASKVVMDKSNGKLDFLGGQNMYTAYSIANANAKADTLTEYDEKINTLWRFEVNKYAEGLSTKEEALNNFKYSVYTQLGLEPEDFDSLDFAFVTEHVRAEPDLNGKGIKFTLTAKEGEKWQPGASFIWENVTHYGIRIEDVPKYDASNTSGNFIVCYYPLTEDKKVYTFNCELAIENGKTIVEKVVVQANGGDAHLTVDGDNFDITLTGKTMTLSKDLSFKMDKSDNVKPYLKYDVNTTNEKTSGERWEVEWKQGLGGGKLPYPEMISALQTDGYDVIYIDSQNLSKLEEDQYYFANLTLEFTIDDYPQSFRTWISAYSDVVKYNFNDLVQNTSEHVSAVPDPDGKGIKFTISAKEGEEWREEDYHITEINSGLYMEINKEKLPKPGKTVVCYWPLANDGESYIFDCDVKLKSEGEKVLHETVVSKAKGSYASVNIDYAALKGLQLNVDSKNATVKLSKDLSRAISASENITATFDFGTFVNESSSEYKWTEWLSTRFPSVTESALYGDGAGISLFNKDKGIVDKLKKYKYFFTDMCLNFEFENDDYITERFRYSEGYQSEIIDSSALLENLTENTHISAEPDANGVKITLRHLETDGEWRQGNVLICLAEDGQDGVNLELVRAKDFEDGVIPTDKYGNRCPTAVESTVEYVYPFTESGKVYEFLLAGPLDKDGEWKSEYVRCAAGGGLGELIDYNEWNNNVKVTDIVADPDKPEFSFKIQGNVASIIENSTEAFVSAELWPDVRPGVEGEDEVDHRGKTFGYASRRVILVGQVDDYNRGPEALNNAFVVESRPGYETLNPTDYDYDNVYAELAKWNNQFYVIMSIQEIRLNNSNMTFHLHWK